VAEGVDQQLRFTYDSHRFRAGSLPVHLLRIPPNDEEDRRGPGGASCKLSAGQLHALEAVLEVGPAACGWRDQCWTLARIAEIVRHRFGVDYTLAGLDLLLHRIGWSVQIPTRKATERDEAKIAAWKDEQWPVIKRGRRTWAAGSASRTRPARA
jgi:transposase